MTAEEAREALPGDEIVVDPMWQSTRGITIAAPPEQVWPWIVQMGFPSQRAGWYTPHWLDRLSFGIKRRSADRIVPELQQLAVGDQVFRRRRTRRRRRWPVPRPSASRSASAP